MRQWNISKIQPLRVMTLLLAGRPLLAAQQCGFGHARLARLSRIAGEQGGVAKRSARLGLYLTLRLGGALPGSAWVGAAAHRIAPALHNALLQRYIAYSRNAGDWFPVGSSMLAMVGAHEAAVLRRLRRLADQAP